MTPDKPSASEARELDDWTRQLLPCPFCGAASYLYENEVDFVKKWSAGCTECNADMDVCEDEEPYAVMAWNTRASPAPQGGEREIILREREACAVVADEHAAWAEDQINHEHSIFGTVSNTADDIAAMIRNRENPEWQAHRKPKSAPAAECSLPSGESDPAVTLDCAGADTWEIEESVPSDGFEIYYLKQDGITISEICGPQSNRRTQQLSDLVAAANRRFPAATVDIADAFGAADEADWKRLDDLLGHSAHGKFWRNVFVSVRFALTDKRPPMQEEGK